jgi:hypothetical protein
MVVDRFGVRWFRWSKKEQMERRQWHHHGITTGQWSKLFENPLSEKDDLPSGNLT